MEFLGLLVDSNSMKFYLPPPKVTKTTNSQFTTSKKPGFTAPTGAIAGLARSTCPAIWMAPLHFRHLQNRLTQQVTLSKGSYDGLVFLEALAQRELQWWISNIQQVNGSLIHPPTCELTITPDASKLDWGGGTGGHLTGV
jgi:hypothetical protein